MDSFTWDWTTWTSTFLEQFSFRTSPFFRDTTDSNQIFFSMFHFTLSNLISCLLMIWDLHSLNEVEDSVCVKVLKKQFHPPKILERWSTGRQTGECVEDTGVCVGFWRSLRPRGTPVKSSTIHVFENICEYVEYPHDQFRIYGLNVSFWYFEELQVLVVLVLGCWFGSCKVTVANVVHTFVFQNEEDTGLISHGWEDRYSVRSHPQISFFRYLCEGGWISLDLVGKEKKSMVPGKMFEISFLHTSGKKEG
jgi:hypothetical protein